MRIRNLKYLTILFGIIVASLSIILIGDENAQADNELYFFVSDAWNQGQCDNDLSEAEATMELEEKNGRTKIKINVEGAVPNMFYTAWLKLDGASPLTDAGATPLAATTTLAYMEMFTPPKEGTVNLPNGFFTDEEGDGEIEIMLDFLLSSAEYPFPMEPVLIGHIHSPIIPPFTVRLASHCIDLLGHGLLPGPHERAFDIILDLSDLSSEDDDEEDDDDDD